MPLCLRPGDVQVVELKAEAAALGRQRAHGGRSVVDVVQQAAVEIDRDAVLVESLDHPAVRVVELVRAQHQCLELETHGIGHLEALQGRVALHHRGVVEQRLVVEDAAAHPERPYIRVGAQGAHYALDLVLGIGQVRFCAQHNVGDLRPASYIVHDLPQLAIVAVRTQLNAGQVHATELFASAGDDLWPDIGQMTVELGNLFLIVG